MTEKEVKQMASLMTDMIVNGEIEITPIVIDASELFSREDFLEDLVTSEAGFADPLGQLRQFFTDLINSVASWISESIGATVKGFIDWLWDQISPALNSIAGWIDEATKQLQGVGSAFTGFINAILRFPEWFPKWFETYIAKPVVDALNSLAKALWDMLPDWLKDAITTIQNALSDPLGTLKNAFSWLAEQLWNLLPEWLRNAIIGLQEAFNAFVSGLKDFLSDPLGFIKQGFDWLAQRIWELLPEPLKNAFILINNFLTTLWDAVVNLFTVQIPQFFGFLWNEIQAFTRDPLGYLQEKVVTPVWNGLQWLWEQIRGGISWLIPAIFNLFKSVAGIVVDICKGLIGTLVGLGKGMTQFLLEMGKTIVNAFSELMQDLLGRIVEPLEKTLSEGLKKVFEGKEGELQLLGALGVAMIPPYLLIVMFTRMFKSLAHIFSQFRIRLHARLSPLGVGGSLLVNFVSSFARIFYEIGEGLQDVPSKVGTAFLGGFVLAGLEPLRYPFRFAWKQYLNALGFKDVPFEIPPLRMAIDLIQRLGIEEERETFKTILMYRGYPDWFIENFVKTADELSIEVTDRFGKPRTVPLGLLYSQPSLSQLTTMMIRDIFGAGVKGLNEYSKWAYRLGLHKDVAYLMYLLHFRYPPPSTLWEFVSRGISNLLWYKPSTDEVSEATAQASELGINVSKYPIVSPADLNKKYGLLFRGLSAYMKWHDYANFPWYPGFTTDNWLIIDTLADIPTKIDIRWMTRWAIFDFMTSKNIGIDTPVSEFVNVIEGRPANEKVYMDLVLMCRLLQATGLHPYYVPIVAVAETVNAFADERTLLRTGILNLYEYGAMTYSDINKLLSELVIASFHVAYFDIEKRDWSYGYINLPIAFLPAERKLLALRAVIDRYLRVYRDTFRDLDRAYSEYIMDFDTVVEKMSQVVKVINKFFKKATQDIVGREYELKVDVDYVKSVLTSSEIYRDIYTIRRIRSWVYRALGWIIYRSAYGYVTEEDALRVTKTLSDIAKFPSMEATAIQKILSAMVNIATRERGREYIPTPLTLASMAEYIPAIRLFANRVFVAKGVPSEWRSFWLQYIDMRPIIDEVKSVVSSVRRLYEYFIINTDMFTKFLEILKPYGYEDKELKLMTDRSNLDRWYRAYRELVGTPRELVTMAEYSPLARRLALAEVKKRIDALPIEREAKEFLYKLWEDYIRIKPVYDEVEREVTELITDYASGTLTWEQFETLLNELKDWGIDEWEAEAIKFLASIRRRRYELTGQFQAE